MASWLMIGLTEVRARRATRIAGFACLALAVLTLFNGAFQLGALSAMAPDETSQRAISLLLSILLYAFAGHRLITGEGIVSGSVVALSLLLGGVVALFQGDMLNLAVDALFLPIVANGVRAVLALRRGFIDYAEHVEIFR